MSSLGCLFIIDALLIFARRFGDSPFDLRRHQPIEPSGSEPSLFSIQRTVETNHPRAKRAKFVRSSMQVSPKRPAAKPVGSSEWVDLVVDAFDIPKSYFVKHKVSDDGSFELTAWLRMMLKRDQLWKQLEVDLDIPRELEPRVYEQVELPGMDKVNALAQSILASSKGTMPNIPMGPKRKPKPKPPPEPQPKPPEPDRVVIGVSQVLYPSSVSSSSDKMNQPTAVRKGKKGRPRKTLPPPPPPAPPEPKILRQSMPLELPKEDFRGKTLVVHVPQELVPKPAPRRMPFVRPPDFPPPPPPTSSPVDEEYDVVVEEEPVVVVEPPPVVVVPVVRREFDDGRRISMNAMNVGFVQPKFDFGGIGDLDAEELQKELEARTGTVVFKKPEERIKVKKIERKSEPPPNRTSRRPPWP
jgi:hypothetical protein